MSLFFFGNNFYKSKETLRFFLQVLEVYRIFFVKTTLESMLYYTFSVINTVCSTCHTVWNTFHVIKHTKPHLQHSSNLNIEIVHNSIEHFLWNPSDFFSDDVLCCLWIVFTNSVFQVPNQKIVGWVEILGIVWLGVIGFMRNESVPWEVMSEVFKCSVQEMRWRLISRTEQNT